MSIPSFKLHVTWRGIIRVMAYVLAFLLVPLLVGSVVLSTRMSSSARPADRTSYTGQLPAPTYDPTKRIAVVVSSAYGAEINDSLPAFEILARSGAFNVYIVAPKRTVLPFVDSRLEATGLDFVPHFSYAEYAKTIGKTPDLIAIPYFPGYTPTRDAAVLDWIRAHTGPQTTLLGICAGTETLADTGLLAGHKATTNLQWFARLVPRFPNVHWIRNVRYVDDGAVITSTSLAAGIDATFHTVARLVSRSVALDVARQVGYKYTDYLDNPSFQYPSLSTSLPPLLVNGAFEWHQENLGVLLYNGVSEFALAGLLDPYGSSLAATADVIAPTRAPIRSRDGLIFIPRQDFHTVSAVDRVVLPAGDVTDSRQQTIAAWQRLRPDRPVEYIHRNVGRGESAYDATLQDLAQSRNALVAVGVAHILFYPVEQLQFTNARLPIEPIATPLMLGLLGVGLVVAFDRVSKRRRTQARSRTQVRSDALSRS